MQQGIFSGQQQQQQQQQMSSVTQMANALVMPLVFGDSRDLTVKKFNQLQAYSGHGKGIVNHAQSIDFNQDNPYCRFKVLGINSTTLFTYLWLVFSIDDIAILIFSSFKNSVVCNVPIITFCLGKT